MLNLGLRYISSLGVLKYFKQFPYLNIGTKVVIQELKTITN